MYSRGIAKETKRLAEHFPAVVILGPRQSGKTTLAKQCFPSYKYFNREIFYWQDGVSHRHQHNADRNEEGAE